MIYTFYSYKGGVGRSMALANIAELFYQKGLSVLMIDWDLEAPGLELFYPEMKKTFDTPGVADLLKDYKQRMSQFVEGDQPPNSVYPLDTLSPYLIDVYPNSKEKKFQFISAGKRTEKNLKGYVHFVRNFDWKEFYQDWGGGLFFEWLRKEFLKLADVVLIDSRTGVSEMGGVCTFQLADAVVMFCAPNHQNIEGTYQMVQDLETPQVLESRNHRPLKRIVIPSRVEITSEKGLLDQFRSDFIAKFDSLMPPSTKKYYPSFWNFKIPQIPFYAFYEQIAMRGEISAKNEELAAAYSSLFFLMLDLSEKDQFLQIKKDLKK